MPQDESSTATVFYSWQSQLPNSTNRSFIKDALDRAATAVKNDVTIDARPEIDQDTANTPGSPNIADTIRAKIDAAEIVVCDVSIVQGLDGDGDRVRPTPNPNVLIELGYAMKSLGTMDRLVLVMNTAYGGIKELPFDLRQYRPTTYSLPEDAKDKSAARKELASKLEATFRHVFRKPNRHAKPASPVELTLSYVKKSGSTGDIHHYEIVARMRNTGSARLDDWYIEVEVPTLLLDPDTRFGALVRSDADVALFRTKGLPPILCGDDYVFKVPYRVDSELYRKIHYDLDQLKARARAFVDGEPVAESELTKLQNF